MSRRYVGIGMIVVMLWGLSVGWAQSGRAPGLVLLTPQEAAVLRLTEEEWAEPVGAKTKALGPLIVVQAPTPQATPQGPTIVTVTPMDLTVLFEAQGTAVDMTSLRVQGRKGIFTKDLTPLLRPYVQGTRVEAKGVQIPTGRFKLEVEITDRQGTKTAETYRVEIKE